MTFDDSQSDQPVQVGRFLRLPEYVTTLREADPGTSEQMRTPTLVVLIHVAALQVCAQTLRLPPRPTDAPSGSEFAALVSTLPRDLREAHIFNQIVRGNIPTRLREFVPVPITRTMDGARQIITFFVLPDYLAVGSDEDFLLMPMTPMLAQAVADTTGCILPTRTMVDHTYGSATVKLRPQPIAPSAAMTTVPVFVQHNDSIRNQHKMLRTEASRGTLVAGHKKDIIISNAIYHNLKPGIERPVVIYGWHMKDGTPIQPVYNGHAETYADYSHGVRLVQRNAMLDGHTVDVADLLRDSVLCVLLSDEGPLPHPRYGPPR